MKPLCIIMKIDSAAVNNIRLYYTFGHMACQERRGCQVQAEENIEQM